MRKFILFWAGLAIVISTVLIAANFSKTYNVPVRKDQARPENQMIAYLSYDFNALIDHYNAMRTSVTYGYIDIPLTGLREVDATGDVGAIAANGGVLASDTTPILEAAIGVTKKGQRINWAASNNDPLMYTMMLPYDFKDSSDVTFDARVSSDGTSDNIGFTVAYYFNEDDVTGDETTDTAHPSDYTHITATIPAADVTTDSETLTIILTPFAHTSYKVYLSGARLKYVRDF